MKKNIAAILLCITHMLSYIFPYLFISSLNRFIARSLYTGWICREFESFGVDSFVIPFFSFLKGAKYISIGDNCRISSRVTLTAYDAYIDEKFHPEIVIGNNCSIGEDSHITAINSIKLGDNVLLGKNILITDNAHGQSISNLLDIAPDFRPLSSKGPVLIDDNVWIGEKSSIMPGVHIGKGVIVAANSVVTKDVPPYCVVAGIPATIVKEMRGG